MERENKIPEITIIFWVMKVVATTLGETLGDYFSMTLELGYLISIIIILVFFLFVLILQLLVPKYIPAVFWLVIVGTTTLGTEISDFIDRTLHIGYPAGSLLLSICLALTLFVWYKKFNNIEVYPIYSRTKEIFFWIAVLFSNSLGTAFGDFLSDNFGMSYLEGALITGIIIVIVVMIHYFIKMNQVILFWIAFVFTRPFGATFGDFLTKPAESGGLNLGRLASSLVSIFILVILVYISHRVHSKARLLKAD